jgi:fructose-1,6-bisphosphatase/inositol monophosphatase family enzyme
VEVQGTVVAGAVVAPERGEEFCAMLGAGAWLWQARGGPPVPLKCTAGIPLAQALIGTGFGYEARRRQVQGEVVAAVLPQVRDVRRGGSAAIDLCSVAAGRLDGYYERGTNYWDIAAGGLIASEAGAQVAGLAGRPAGPAMTVAAGPGVFGALQDLLASLNPERDA